MFFKDYLDATFGDVWIFTNNISLLIDFFCPPVDITRRPVIHIVQVSVNDKLVYY